MVGYCQSRHAVGNSFVYEVLDSGLAVEEGILGVDV